MKIALDTNVLAYAEGTNGAAMRDNAPPAAVANPFAPALHPMLAAVLTTPRGNMTTRR